MPKSLLLLCLTSIFLTGCARDEASRESAAPSAAAAAGGVEKCVLTQSIQSRAPENTEGGPADADVRSWFVNADRTIWMFDVPRVAGQRTKTAWFRPARTRLEVAGRRLDADAPPLVVEASPSGDEYRHMFQPSNMTFPTSGCWEITAKAGQSQARFVVKVSDAS